MTLTIRAADRDDIPALADLAGQTLFPADYLAPMIEPYLAGTEAIWLAALRGDLAGFAYAEPEFMTEGTWNLRALAAGPRRQGIGRALLRSAETAVRKAGGRLLVIDTTQLPEQEAARRLYLSDGYSQVGHIPEFFGLGEDKVTFCKTL